ncbi:hypothetical protein [Clostridium sp.]|uniref:hypothetical protein n=1 Tax=Clostridium sp. TaxID=1506 RepID=UPI002633F2DB|nr:hypothetical protein [Clostridium sp.]
MKKFILATVILVLGIFALNYAVYYGGFYIDFNPNKPITAISKSDSEKIYIKEKEGEYKEILIKGVEVSSSIPGHYGTDYAIDKETWIRWFSEIQEMGSNTIRVNTIYNDIFYNAFYEYNINREEHLYLLQGIQVSDYANNSEKDAYSREFYDTLKEDSLDIIDIIHGKKSIITNKIKGSGNYRKDISPWVLGYIVGNEWNPGTVAYTNNRGLYSKTYEGKYFSTKESATAFEAMLAKVVDYMVSYESKKYKTQRLISFINDPQNDPFVYDEFYAKQLSKYNVIDAENIITTDELQSGFFASYRLYEFCPRFSDYFSKEEKENLRNILPNLNKELFYDGYTQLLANYHSMPVVITEYGFSSSRGTDDIDGPLTEKEQGKSLASTYNDIVSSGCNGAVISTWQDVWQRRTWNTSYSVNVKETYRWHDIQSSGTGYGLLSFDTGEKKSTCYVDGDLSEWEEKDEILNSGGINLSAKYDESFLYLLIEKEGISEETKLYIPIDITPKSGSTVMEDSNLNFELGTDFLISINGRNDSKIMVQRRYEALRENYLMQTNNEDPFILFPAKDSLEFVPINMICKNDNLISEDMTDEEIINIKLFKTYETGELVYGNGNPNSKDYNSLGDFCYGEDFVEIRIPWQLLNYYNPADMEVHDDYYENYGVEGISITEIYIGAYELGYEGIIPMEAIKLKGWRDKISYHERLKESYFILKESWGR